MRAAPQHQDDPLTGRQKECMLLLQDGLSSKQIARELGISPRTVDQHISAAFTVVWKLFPSFTIKSLWKSRKAPNLLKHRRATSASIT